MRLLVSLLSSFRIVEAHPREPTMQRLTTTRALLVLLDTSVGIAQTVSPANRTASSATDPDWQRQLDGAPVGHRQPRAYQVPSDKDLSDPKIQSIEKTRPSTARSRRFAGVAKAMAF